MPSFNGTVEAISVKPLPDLDKYENTHRATIMIGEDWYTFGAIKNGIQGQLWTKNGMITKGAVIEGMYDLNGDFRNIRKATISILKEGVPAASVASDKVSAQSSAGTPKGKDAYVIGMAIGASMNQAVSLHGPVGKNKDVDFDFLEKTCLQLYNITQPLINDLSNGKDVEKNVVEKSPPNTGNPDPDNSFDDDIPF